MSLLRRVAWTFLVTQTIASGVAWACKCRGDGYSPEDQLAANAQVFVGNAISGPSGGCGGEPVVYTLTVTEAFKGVELGEEVAITTEADGASCGVEFEVGEAWLVYTEDGTYGLCDPGGPAAARSDDIEALRAAAGD